jgi:hypothetical protein
MRRFVAMLLLCRPFGSGGAIDAEPTYCRDIAPIVWKNCAGCHRPGEVGPFSLLTYRDVANRATFLTDVVESRRMPPWKPEPGFGAFHDERRLSDDEIRKIADWVISGVPEGDAKDLPPQPVFPEGWQLGKPDLVLKMPDAFAVPASGRDVYRCFVIPVSIDSDRTVAAVEFRPGNRKVVHHALFYLDSSGTARKKDEADDGPGYVSFGGPGFLPTGALGGWAPGAMPRFLPDGVGRYLRKGSDLVLQIHYHPDGKPETDQYVVGVYFTRTRAPKIVGGILVRSRQLNIPAGDGRYHVSAKSDPLPAAAQAIGITPHMHFIGKEMKVIAELPDGTTVPLIWIKDWDFNWQGQYQYQSPIYLAKGTVIKLDAYYDNSAENPRNPSNPPKRVRWGEQTTDEMCLLSIQIVTNNVADLLKIVSMRGNRLGALLAAEAASTSLPTGVELRQEDHGYLIPDEFRGRLGRFDKNGDGKLSSEEIDVMPTAARERFRQAIKSLENR